MIADWLWLHHRDRMNASQNSIAWWHHRRRCRSVGCQTWQVLNASVEVHEFVAMKLDDDSNRQYHRRYHRSNWYMIWLNKQGRMETILPPYYPWLVNWLICWCVCIQSISWPQHQQAGHKVIKHGNGSDACRSATQSITADDCGCTMSMYLMP